MSGWPYGYRVPFTSEGTYPARAFPRRMRRPPRASLQKAHRTPLQFRRYMERFAIDTNDAVTFMPPLVRRSRMTPSATAELGFDGL